MSLNLRNKLFSWRRKRNVDQPKRELRYAEVIDREKRRKRKLRFFLVLLGIICLTLSIFFLTSLLKVKHIACTLDEGECPAELKQKTNAIRGRTMLADLGLSHAYMGVKMVRVWPDGLRVHFSRPKLLISFHRSQSETLGYSITENGYIVSHINEAQSIIAVDLMLENKSEGEKIEVTQLEFYNQLINSLQSKSNLKLIQIKVITQDEVQLYLEENVMAIAYMSKIDRALFSLQAIWESPTIEKAGKVIDLRFENPILK